MKNTSNCIFKYCSYQDFPYPGGLDAFLISKKQRGYAVPRDIWSLYGRGYEAAWLTDRLEYAASFVFGTDEIRDNKIKLSEIHSAVQTLELDSGWKKIPHINDGLGSFLYIKHPKFTKS